MEDLEWNEKIFIESDNNFREWFHKAQELEEENEKLKEEIRSYEVNKARDIVVKLTKENEKLEEEIKDLKEQIEYDKETIQELVDMGIKAIDEKGEVQDKAKKLERELSILKEKYGDIDL